MGWLRFGFGLRELLWFGSEYTSNKNHVFDPIRVNAVLHMAF